MHVLIGGMVPCDDRLLFSLSASGILWGMIEIRGNVEMNVGGQVGQML